MPSIPLCYNAGELLMIRRSFLKLAATVLLHPALNWQLVPLDQAVREAFYHMVMYVHFDGDVTYNNSIVVTRKFLETHNRLYGPGLLLGRKMVVSERIDV